jgi:hypothetical protein
LATEITCIIPDSDDPDETAENNLLNLPTCP